MLSMAAWSSGRVRSIATNDYNFKTASSMTSPANSTEQLTTLFALGREVASVLDLDELLHKIPHLIARLTKFTAFAAYLLDAKTNELTIAYSVGYPETTSKTLRVPIGHGLVGAA